LVVEKPGASPTQKKIHRGSLLQCFRHGFKPAPRVGEEKSELQPFMLAGFGARCLAKLSHCFLVLIVATGFKQVEVLTLVFF